MKTGKCKSCKNERILYWMNLCEACYNLQKKIVLRDKIEREKERLAREQTNS